MPHHTAGDQGAADALAVILNPAGDKILLLRTTDSTAMQLPGGAVALGEYPRHAVTRLMLTELGILCEPEQLLISDFVHQTDERREGYVFLFFGGRWDEDTSFTLRDKRVLEALWMPIEFLSANTTPHQVRRIQHALAALRDPAGAERDLVMGFPGPQAYANDPIVAA